MATRVVEWKKPYTWWKAISIDENKVISLNLRDENNLIIYDEWDDEIYVDLQLDDEITPTDAFPIWVNVGRVIVDNWWDKPWTIISAVTTSGDNIKVFYADEWTLWMDNWTGTFKQIYFKADVDALLLALRNYIDWELAKKQNWVSSDTAPSNPSEWDLWYDTTNSAMKVWDWTAWQSVWWWDVLVSDQANNIFTPWMKIWGGTESDYQSLTPDSNTAYLLLAGWPTPRQPWVNTIAYYPLDSTNTVNDLSWNNYNLTNKWNVTFGVNNWVDCATFWNSTPRWLVNTSANIISWQYTYLTWINMDMSSYAWGWARVFGWTSNFFILIWELPNNHNMCPQRPMTDWVTLTAWWHLVCFVWDVTTGNFTSYLDGVSVSSWIGLSWSMSWIVIWAKENDYTHSDDRFKWNMSAIIWENKQRTSQEISDYYDLTKWDYWIS